MYLLLEMNSISTTSVLAPIVLSVAAMSLSLVVKWVMNALSFKRDNPARGHELFRIFFLGPDLALLSLGLLASSQALSSLLKGYGIKTNFGEEFALYFWACVFGMFFGLFFCVLCWLVHDDDERAFIIRPDKETLRGRDGKEYEREVWAVSWRETFKRRQFYFVLGVGNFLGVACVVSYSWFIVKGFVR